MVRNEERQIAEWLAWQHAIGVDLTIVYDNESTDCTADIVRTIAQVQSIELINWPGDAKRQHSRAFRDCVSRHKSDLDWILFSDSDEFFVPLVHAGIHEFVADPRYVGAAGIGVNWAIFGSSGHEDYPEGLTIESFTRRAPNEFSANCHVKSLLRPAAICGTIASHVATIDGPYVDADGEPIVWSKPGKSVRTPSLSVAQINHYFTRSKAHWARRMERGYGSDKPRTWDEFCMHDRNEVEDLSAVRFLPEVRSRIERYHELPAVGTSPVGRRRLWPRMRQAFAQARGNAPSSVGFKTPR